LVLQSSRTPGGHLDLRRAQDAHDRSNSRRKLGGIGDSRLWRPLDQDRSGRVRALNQLDRKSIGLRNRADCQEPI
jgi:hypothetical protein